MRVQSKLFSIKLFETSNKSTESFRFSTKRHPAIFSFFKMSSKLAIVLAAFCLVYLLETEGSFIKPNNVPRVGRSNEAEHYEGEDNLMGYVIKTNKNIPRMGRRNYDSENRFDIPKFYKLPVENDVYEDEPESQNENYYKQLHNMK